MIQAIKTIVSNSDGDEVDLTFEYGEDGDYVSIFLNGKWICSMGWDNNLKKIFKKALKIWN